MNETILVTGAAGFIGFHVARRLLDNGWTVHGVDSLNVYYDLRLKEARLAELAASSRFYFHKGDLSDRIATAALFEKTRCRYVVHLAAQPGVAYSAVNPGSYIDANIVGFANVLEGCRHTQCKHLLYASSSSVYGANRDMPLRESDRVDEPLSLYGATKRANELMAYAYARQFGLSATGLRFFTVYGPWGRPDMAVWLFTEAIFRGEPLKLFNSGHMRRDFTYVDDVIEAVGRLVSMAPENSPPHKVYNVGNSQPIENIQLVAVLESVIGKPARRELLPMRSVDVLETFADSSQLQRATGFAPRTSIEQGLRTFVEWYRKYTQQSAT